MPTGPGVRPDVFQTVVDLLRYRAITQPGHTAYSFLADDGSVQAALTYDELDRLARGIAVNISRTTEPGERVLMVCPPGISYLISFFGCLYAGIVAVPVYPPRLNRSVNRLEAIAADAQPSAALTTNEILSRSDLALAKSALLKKLRWLVVDDVASSLDGEWNEPVIGEEALAILQYTSGSTGVPKGVVLTHRNLLHNSSLLSRAFEYSSESHVVSWLPVYHDMGLIGGVLQPLHGGFPGTLMSPVAFLQQPIRWLEAISRFQATISGAPDFAYDMCVRKIRKEQKAGIDLSSWTVAFNGSEPVRADTMDRFAAAFEECGFRREAFYPCYGLAEATLIVSGGIKGSLPVVKTVSASALGRNQVADPFEKQDRKVLIGCGKPVGDQKIRIVEPATLKPCPPNYVGEIWVSGDSVAGGYWNRPAETEQVFQARLADCNDRSFLRTGDLGFLTDGELFIAGRLKDIIIIRGLNYYPQDIELTVERSHMALRPGCGAAFTVEKDESERLVIVHEIDPRKRPDTGDIVNRIRQSVTEEYDLSLEAIALIKPGSLPKTSSGKVQRSASRDAFLEGRLEIIDRWHAPARQKERDELDLRISSYGSAEDMRQWLAALLAAKLGVTTEEIDTAQPLSLYGLDSLAAIELAHAVETTLGVGVPLVTFLDSPSIAAFADELLSLLRGSAPNSGRPAGDGQSATEFPLSKGQEALWFLHRLNPESPAYNIAAGVRISGSIDIAAIKQAFRILVGRHASLRTTFELRDSKPIQCVHAEAQPVFEHTNVGDWPDALLSQRIIEEVHRPFDLESGPVLRIRLFCRSTAEALLVLVVHHIAADFWSLSLLTSELGELYSVLSSGGEPSLASLGADYSDYVRRQQELLSSAEGERLWKYWESQLGGALPELNLPADRPRPPLQTYAGDSSPFALDADLSRKLKALAKTQRTTLFSLLLASFQVFLHRHCDQDDIIVGSLSAGRRWASTSGVVGYFVNPLALRGNLSGHPRFLRFLGHTRETVLRSLAHQDYPFPLVVERLQPNRDPSRSPLFQVTFVLQKSNRLDEQGLSAFALGEEGARIEFGDLVFESVALEQRVAQFDLTLVVAEVNDRLGCSLQYSTALFDRWTVVRMSAQFTELLRSIVSGPERRLAELALLSENERQQLLIDWNDTGVDHHPEICVAQLFEQCVERQPGAPAIVFGDRQLDYYELNRRANQLANYLRRLGVGPETPVGLCIGRSLDMVIGLLGVLKAGGAFVPVDPGFPKERVTFMLADSGAQAVLTSGQTAALLNGVETRVVSLDGEWTQIAEESVERPERTSEAANLCYVIYTSGSTGRPKGVMVTHRNVVNFFKGMDERVGCDNTDTLLAVTSISFDISILELLWTLTKGSKVVIVNEHHPAAARRSRPAKKVDFSLFYFASDDQAGAEAYRLLFEGARFADRNGFAAVWTPERHFHAFGGLYPNPSVTAAALAAITERVSIRAGSVVMPLHNPIRVAEEWSLVDNISRGRAGVAFASGWHADDFVFFPDNYERRKETMIQGIETVQKLWRGESIAVRGGAENEVTIRLFPKPVQPELPIWLTAAGAPDTFIKAGEMGAGVLTHLLGQTVEEVAERVKLYREALARSGRDPATGQVTLMLHTFIGGDREEVRRIVCGPFTNYLRSSIGLIGNLIRSLNLPLDLNTMSAKDMDDLLMYAFDRYFETGALFGTPETCEAMVDRLREIGVDEIGCLIDYGVATEAVLASLEHLRVIKEEAGAAKVFIDRSLGAQARRNKATMMQCTPSMMMMQMLNPDSKSALGSLRTLMLGGEALPPNLVEQIRSEFRCRLVNMYGPTETTIWSATHDIGEPAAVIPIGRPIANTRFYILDKYQQPVPFGVPGELYIGGAGVARGYFNRPALCAERFVPDQFAAEAGARMYKTGDIVRFLPNGAVEFIGRLDHQVKLRGHRIELGEIESALCQIGAVREAVVVSYEAAPGDKRLVGYVVLSEPNAISTNRIRSLLKDKLPDYMVPSLLVLLESLPQTPNGKVDRKALPMPDPARTEAKSRYTAPTNKLEQIIAAAWQEALKFDRVGIHDNFFDIGGHSLLMAQVHSRLRTQLDERDLPLIKLLEHPTISSLARFLAGKKEGQVSLERNYSRAQKQRESLKRQNRGLKAVPTGK